MHLWESNIELSARDRLEGDKRTDVLIIGGGIAGILCAYMLKSHGVDNILLEASKIGSGTTKGTTAVITAQHGNIYTKLVKKFGGEKAKLYLETNLESVREYENISKTLDIDCEFEKKPSYVYSHTDEQSLNVETAIVKELGRDIGYKAHFTKETGLPFETAGAVCFPDMAQFHPLKFLAAISQDLNIYENSMVRKVKGHKAYTKEGTVTADKIIFASHYPFVNLRGLYPLKLYQKRSFVIALRNAPTVGGTYVEDKERGIYLRNYKDLLLVGGGDHRTGTAQDGFKIVRRFISENFPDSKEEYAWAAQDCISLDNVPYAGRYCKGEKDWYVMSGFNEWGMTSAMSTAAVISDMVIGRKNKYTEIFDPGRSMLSKQLITNMGDTLKNFCIPGGKRCTHLGCRLKKNLEENTWDCPCHGSRFDSRGHLIDDPAMRDL